MENGPQLAIAKLDGVEEENDIIELMNPDGRGYVLELRTVTAVRVPRVQAGAWRHAADETLAWVEFVVIESGPLSCNLKMFLQAGAFDGASKDSRSLAGRRIRREFLARLLSTPTGRRPTR